MQLLRSMPEMKITPDPPRQAPFGEAPHSFDSGPRVSSSLLEADPSIGVCCKILWIGAKRPTRESALGFKSNHAQSFLVKGEGHRCSKACAGVLDFLGPGSRKLTN